MSLCLLWCAAGVKHKVSSFNFHFIDCGSYNEVGDGVNLTITMSLGHKHNAAYGSDTVLCR